MENNFYITVSSSGRGFIPESNSHSQFTVNLDQPLHFEADLYECSLVDLILDVGEYNKNQNGIILVSSNLAAEQQFNSTRLPLLRLCHIQRSKVNYMEFKCPHYIPVKNGILGSIEINILNAHGEIISFLRDTSYCTLHFRRRRR